MPLGDEKHGEIRAALVEILGEDFVYDDPAVMECYRREAQSPSYTTLMNPEFVVFPGSAADVQSIVKLANRLGFPYSVSCTGTLTAYCSATKPYWVWLDPKRMNRLEIDGRNMYAIVEPYVTHAQLSAEARKLGLFNGTPSAGGQTSCLANTVALGMQNAAYRTGRASRNLLGLEMVLPNGEIVRTGTLAMGQGGHFWGEGPGPDLRGIVRAHSGHLGSLGIVTRIGVKLYPWPGPAVFPTDGTSPRKKCVIPADKLRWRLVRYERWENAIEAVREVGKAEIGSFVALLSPWYMAVHYCKSREEHHKLWASGWFHENFGYCLVIGLWAQASSRQIAYEEDVLAQISLETSGTLVEGEPYDLWVQHVANRLILDPFAPRAQRIPMGAPDVVAGGTVYDSLSDAYRNMPKLDWVALWVVPIDYAHFAMIAATPEIAPGEKSPAYEARLDNWGMQLFSAHVKDKVADSTVIGGNVGYMAPAFGLNNHVLVAKIKSVLDPLNLANPGRLISMEQMTPAGQQPEAAPVVGAVTHADY